MKTGEILQADSEDVSFRSSFRMRLKPEAKTQYVALHAAIWPELASLLSEFGVKDYSIFLDENGIDLFAVRRTHDNLVDQNLRAHPVMKRWWAEMLPLMECDADGVPLTWPLVEVFYLP
jgi:L-rhamnose mutarotase